MLPIPDLVDGEAELGRKIVLRKAQLLANIADVDLRRDIELGRLRVAARDLQREKAREVAELRRSELIVLEID
ncbi:hypothetical protein AYJ54_00820 [Bradyrhizobium centrolobii]|uniref:Uncharacterized protein n=1 Tax=Bradyrhizobium centrolobii TaxID=1505087 RepID=A0A176YFT3_9BRAD|nr:hypothetical protein [Bradyrhizobium centrolobii]OAF05481.1 hypothetical protein AYJ54_00820 [Bradyrhizobium centrolobii]